MTVLHLSLLLTAAVLIGQAAKVQLIEGDQWSERARRQQYRTGTVAVPRGTILDGSGNILAESREMFRVSIAPNEVRDPAALTRELSKAGMPEQWIRASTDRSRRWVTLPGLHLGSAVAGITAVRGAHALAVPGREYVSAEGIRQIVGSVDAQGNAVSGIELALDSILRGDSSAAIVARDVGGRRLDSPEMWVHANRRGANVTLTINRDLQEICERALAQATRSLDATGGDIVILQPRTGEILAMASLRRQQRSMSNTAVTEPFEPGSTLKPFIAAALLERGRARPDEAVDTHDGEMMLGDRRITDIKKASQMTLAEVIRYSSNIGIVKFSERLTPRERYETLRDLGLGVATGVPIPGEADGTLREPARWNRTSAASMVMGYEVAVTPLQLVSAYAVIANGGLLMQPHVIREIRSAEGDLLYKASPRMVRRVFSEEVSSRMRRLLRGVVDSGTAVRADLMTFEIAGKSGTARRAVEGVGYVAGNYTASFVGLFPADEPQYVVLVKLDSPRKAFYGGEIAAPVTAVVLRAALAARDAALDREDLVRFERDVSLVPVGDSSGDTSAAEPIERPAAEVASEPLPVEERASPEPTPRPATLIELQFSRPPPAPPASPPRPVPDVSGLSTRAAVRALHQAGFRVALSRRQRDLTVPAAGALLPAGSLVKLLHDR